MGSYSENPKWEDVTPFPQDDGGPNPLAAISYTEGYAEAMAYLRAIMAANEMSERALELTDDIIGMNPAHYTVWLYRAKILTSLDRDMRQEIVWLNQVALAHQKNYQIWHHRQMLLDRINDPAGEIAFINRMLKGDAKNYHVWSYRQWLVRRFGLWTSTQDNGRTDPEMLEPSDDEDTSLTQPDAPPPPPRSTELEETALFIATDVRNNSAWNHRFFLVNANENSPGVRDSTIYDRELGFAKAAVRRAPQNQSPWNYLRGTVERAHGKDGIVQLKDFCGEFVNLDAAEDNNYVTSSHALQLLAEILGREKRVADARRALDLLATKYDPIRVNYWNYLKGRLSDGGEGTAVAAS
ncbi:protein prenylyltransferase [Myriangium duriaei CBS 260.36]|uniref:Protein farnesyltransferase/geranylgeranyltransferase type-1 subunit alpha n=1 Tax=Myriangium duriaei CBS 260.36 TaxID=1168546 RepID=A0A9P4JA61_9PEZI|nr:protein prenylyltransferase [Myriangium duriaei CBS 260.36]